jgi:glycosyltransferase involved in cell wall biosynthesis
VYSDEAALNLLIAVDTFFPDAPGGMARVAWDVAKAMARRGHEVGLVAGDLEPAHSPAAIRERAVEGVTVFQYAKPLASGWNPMRASRQIDDCRRAIAAVLGRRPWDVVHAHSIYTANAVAALENAPPLVLTVHSPAIQEVVYNWRQQGALGAVTAWLGTSQIRRLERRAIRAASLMHVLSRHTAHEMEREYPADRRECQIIPHWADSDWFRTTSRAEARARLGWPHAARILFTVRQLRYRYGIDTAIKAAAPLVSAGRCELYIAGAGSEANRLTAQAARECPAGGVRFLGKLDDDTLRLAYQAADLFVLPTRALECFGLIVLEAFACGLPVIATDVGAIPESVAPVTPNLLVPAEDPVALREKIAAVLDARLAVPSEETLVDYVKLRYGEEDMLRRYDELYRRVGGGHG